MRVMYIKPDEFQELPSYLSPPLFNAMFGSFTTVPAPKGNKNPESTPSWMDVAKSQDIPEPVAEAAPSYAPTTRVQQLTRNVLNSDVEVIGSLRFSDDLLIATRFRPRTSMVSACASGKQVPILILMSSAVLSPIRRLCFFLI